MHFPPFPCPRPQQSCHQGVRLPRLIHLPQRVVRAKHQPETRVGPGLGRVGCVSATQPSRRSTDDKLARHVTPNQESLTGGERERERGRGSAADFHSPITRTLSLSLSLSSSARSGCCDEDTPPPLRLALPAGLQCTHAHSQSHTHTLPYAHKMTIHVLVTRICSLAMRTVSHRRRREESDVKRSVCVCPSPITT